MEDECMEDLMYGAMYARCNGWRIECMEDVMDGGCTLWRM